MKKFYLVFLTLVMNIILAGCSSTVTHSKGDIVAPTGYWYLGDNGERLWRSINPADIPPAATAAVKSYASSIGDGSGR